VGIRREWTKTAIRDALRSRRRAGKSMSPSAIRDDDPGLYQAAKTRLGYDAEIAIRDWGAPRLQTTWTKRAVIEALRERPERRARAAVGAAAVQLFGSMVAARKAAGVPVLRSVWTDPRVTDEIRALGGARPSRTLVAIAQRRFGSWRAALDAAGIPAKTRRWDVDSIVEALRRRVDDGVPLDRTAVRKQDPSLFFAITHRFGSFDRPVQHFIRSGRLPRPARRRA
jgi:hypothetical protein